jgi:antitoxin MazE
MPSKLCKWGNSLGVRLPQYVVERAGLRPGDYLFIRLNDAGDIVIKAVKPRDVHAAYMPADSVAQARNAYSSAEEVRDKW